MANCPAFARFLQREHEILDEMGGTRIIQTIPANLESGTPIVTPKVLNAEELKHVKNAVCQSAVFPLQSFPPLPPLTHPSLYGYPPSLLNFLTDTLVIHRSS